MLNKQDKPLLLALFVLAIGLGLNAVVSLADRPNENLANAGNKDPYEIPKLVLETLEAAATVGIAGFAILQYREARRSGERQLRAYVTVVEGGVYDWSGIGEATQKGNPSTANKAQENIVVAHVWVKNTGQTPARSVVHLMDIRVGPEKLGETDVLSFAGPLEDIGAAVVGPGIAINKRLVKLPFQLPSESLEEIRAQRSCIFVFGKISYLDAFDQPRETNYRLQYSGVWPPIPSGNLVFSRKGNRIT